MTTQRRMIAMVMAALLVLPPGPWPSASAAEALTLEAVEVGSDQVRIVLSGEGQYNTFVTGKPPRLVLQLLGAEYKAVEKSFAGQGRYLRGARGSQYQRTPSLVARVVMDLAEMAPYRVSKEKNVITVRIGAEGDAVAALAVPAVGRPKVAAPALVPAGKTSTAVGETEGMTTQATPELDVMARRADVTKTVAEGEEAPATAAAQGSSRAVEPPKDILARLPRDLVSLDFDNTDVKDVIKLLAAKAKVNIIYGPDVSGNLTLHLADVPFNEAFRTILSLLGLQTTQVGDNILRIVTPGALAKSQSAAAAATRVIRLNYAKAMEIMGAINQVRSAEGRMGTTVADIKTNSLIITESLEGLSSTERLIAQLDVRPRQVLIEVKLVEVGLTNSLHYGIQWDYFAQDGGKLMGQQGTNFLGTSITPKDSPFIKPFDKGTIGVTANPQAGASGRGTGVALPASAVFGAFTFGRVTNNYFLNATLTAAAAQGKVKVLSDPKIATLNNQPANINVTTSIPYVTSNVASTGVQTQSVSYVVTGIQLSVTPSITADGRIMLDINPSVSQPSSSAAASATGAPAVDARNAKTTVLVRDGETVVIGGLINDTVSNQVAKIPILGDIPILGWLFKKKSVTRSRAELLIFVTPKIMQD